MSAIRTTGKPTRASAVVELLILLPVFLLIIFAMMYVGELSIFKERSHFGGQYAMDAQGDQSEARAVRGAVSEEFYPNRTGELTVAEVAAESEDIPEAGEIRAMFDEMSQPVYSVRATGRYVFSGGRLRFVVRTHQSKRLSADGRYAATYSLRDDNVPELCTELAQGWAVRNRVELTYSYSPDYLRIGKWPLEAADLSTKFQSVVRGEKKREVTNPPGGMDHQVDTLTGNSRMPRSGQLPDCPDFGGDEAFWEPD